MKSMLFTNKGLQALGTRQVYRKRMNLYMGYLLCQYSSLKLLGLILIALMVIMFYMLVIAVAIQGI